MITFRGLTWVLIVSLLIATYFACSQHHDIAGAILLCSVGVFTITFATAAFLMREK